MFNWTAGFISKLVGNSDLLYASIIVASLNMLIQLGIDFICCGSKKWAKLGGWFD